MQIDPDIVIVIATLLNLLAFSSLVAGWVDGRLSRRGLGTLAIGLGLLGFVHLALREGGLTFRAIPDAFIQVVAMVLG
jgi:hypothetical protein